MKRVIIRFKQPINELKYEIYYKEIPKILSRYYYYKLSKKKCWDIEILSEDDLKNLLKWR